MIICDSKPARMNRVILLLLCIPFILSSCSNAGIVSGNYSGKFYYTDTAVFYTDTSDATVVISEVNKEFIQIDITNSQSLSFTNYAQLTKNADQAYNLVYNDPLGTESLSGYYYEGYVHFTYAKASIDYMFDGERK